MTGCSTSCAQASLATTTAHIISLLSNPSELSNARKPLVISLDAFDLFTQRPRQALLYCLLDAVQAGSYPAGLAVIGLTSRLVSLHFPVRHREPS